MMPRRTKRLMLYAGRLAALTALLCGPHVSAQMTQMGNVHVFWGDPEDIAVQAYGGSTYVYVTMNESDTPVTQFNVTDPANPTYIGSLEAPLWAVSLELFENHLLVPGSGGEVAIFDVTDPLSVTEAGTVFNGTGGRIEYVLVQRVGADTVYAYFDGSNDAFDIWDITHPEAPFRIIRLPHSGMAGFISAHPSGRYLYAASDTLRVYQVLPADSIRQVHTQPTGSTSVRSFAVHPAGTEAYLATETGVRIFDISAPAAPVEIGDFTPHESDPDPVPGMKGNYNCAAVSDDGRYLYMSGRLGYQQRNEGGDIDTSDVIPPGWEVQLFAPYWGQIRCGRVIGQATTSKGGFQVLDLTDPLNPVEVGHWVDNLHPNYMMGLDVRGDSVYVTDIRYGFRVFDVSDAAAPVLLGGYHCSGHSVDVLVEEDYAYISQNLGGSVIVVDVSDKLNPEIASAYDTGYELWNVLPSPGDYIYLRGWTASPQPGGTYTLEVIDVSDPLNAFRAGTYIPNSNLGGLLEGKYFYSEEGAIYDLSDPSHPIVAGTMNRPDGGVAGSIDKLGRYVYMYFQYAPNSCLYVIDASDIRRWAPLTVGSTTMPARGFCRTVADRRDGVRRVYVGLQDLGIGVVDVSDPTDPVYLGNITTDAGGQPIEPVKDIWCSGDRMWITSYEWSGHLSEYDISSGVENAVLIQRLPNVGHTWRTRFSDGYAYRVAINGLDIIEAPASAAPDSTPPDSVVDFEATWDHNHVHLSWTNPPDSGFAATKVMRRADRFPIGLLDGDQVYDGDVPWYRDSNIDSNTTYYYTAFAYDRHQNYAQAGVSSRDSAYVADPYPPGLIDQFRAAGLHEQVWMRWKSPPDSDLAGARIVRRTDRYPSSPQDGTTAYEGPGTEAWDSGLANGETYYYSAFAYDIYGNLGLTSDYGRDLAVPARVVFQDDFEMETLGELPSRWDVRNRADSVNTCRVWSDSLLPFFGTAFPLGSKVMGGYYSGSAPGERGWFIDGLPLLDSCTVYFDILDPDDPESYELAYVFSSWLDEANYNWIQLGPNYYRLTRLDQVVADTAEGMQFNPSLPVGPQADWFSMRINLCPERLSVFANGMLMFSVENDTVIYFVNDQQGSAPWPTHFAGPAGLIGLGAQRGVYYDNVIVTTLDESLSGAEGQGLLRGLGQAVPNPFRHDTTIGYMVAKDCIVSIEVFDVRGRLVRCLSRGCVGAGSHAVRWDGRDENKSMLPSGIYFIRAATADYSQTAKCVLLR